MGWLTNLFRKKHRHQKRTVLSFNDEATTPPPYVSLILSESWHLKHTSPVDGLIAELGYPIERRDGLIVITCGTDQPTQAELARKLIRMDVAFCAGPASPSEVLSVLQVNGLIATYTEISWSAPGEWRTRIVEYPAGTMKPPWEKYDYPQGDFGWRMGRGEAYLDLFNKWWNSKTSEEKRQYTSEHPAPPGWEGFYEVLEPSNIDWEEQGTLYHTVGGYKIRTDPLWILLIAAVQGHEGDIADMTITMASGLTYGPDDIRALAARSDRKRS